MWVQLSTTVGSEHVEWVADALSECGAVSVTLEESNDEALFQLHPRETPLWKLTRVVALFPENTDADSVIAALRQRFHLDPPLDFKSVLIEDQDWVRLTQQHFPVQQFNVRLWVLPKWCDEKEYTGITVTIDPGLAFGTGTHPTTQLCLEWLAEHPPKNQVVVDYGCGSGILALAALALGAQHVWAIDHDHQALQATHNNALLNDFVNEGNLKIQSSNEIPAVQSSLIIANILANPLIECASRIRQLAAFDATLILSGILEHEVDRVADAYQPDFSLCAVAIKDGWVRLQLQRCV